VAKESDQKNGTVETTKPSMTSRIIPIFLVTILAGGGGFLQGALFRGNSTVGAGGADVSAASPTSEDETVSNLKKEGPVTAKAIVRTLAPIISNLGSPSETWMRLEISILIDRTVQLDQDVLAVKASDVVVSLLRTVELKKIEGPSGFLHFREDLNDALTAAFDGKITGVLIGSMVVE
jgi:flagellar protein FliL